MSKTKFAATITALVVASAVTAFGVIGSKDIGACGNYVWVVTKTHATQSSNQEDCYLAYGNPANGTAWTVTTGHYGIRCAVSESGLCFHINATGDYVWVANWGGGLNTYYQCPSGVQATDVGVGTSGSNAYPWIIGLSSGQYYIYKYNGSGWDNMTTGFSGTPSRISVNPYLYSKAMVANTNGQLYIWCPVSNAWAQYYSNSRYMGRDVGFAAIPQQCVTIFFWCGYGTETHLDLFCNVKTTCNLFPVQYGWADLTSVLKSSGDYGVSTYIDGTTPKIWMVQPNGDAWFHDGSWWHGPY